MSLVAGVTVPPEVVDEVELVLLVVELAVLEVVELVEELVPPEPPLVGESLPPPQAASPSEKTEINASRRPTSHHVALISGTPRKTTGTLGLSTLTEKCEQKKRAPEGALSDFR